MASEELQKEFREKSPIRRGGLKVCFFLGLVLIELLLIKSGTNTTVDTWQDFVWVLIAVIIIVPLRSWIYYPGYAVWFRRYWLCNVVGYQLNYFPSDDQSMEAEQDITLRSHHKSAYIEIGLHMGGWFGRDRVRIRIPREFKYDDHGIKIRVESLGISYHPSLTVWDWEGSKLVHMDVRVLLNLIRASQQPDGSFRVLRIKELFDLARVDQQRLEVLLTHLTQVVRDMDGTVRLSRSKEGIRFRAVLADKILPLLTKSDPRRKFLEKTEKEVGTKSA